MQENCKPEPKAPKFLYTDISMGEYYSFQRRGYSVHKTEATPIEERILKLMLERNYYRPSGAIAPFALCATFTAKHEVERPLPGVVRILLDPAREDLAKRLLWSNDIEPSDDEFAKEIKKYAAYILEIGEDEIAYTIFG